MSKIDLLHGDCLELMKDIPDGSIDINNRGDYYYREIY